jgi:hypothetical protein
MTGSSAPAFRPDCVQKMAAFEQLCAWLESSAELDMYSLDELRNHTIAAGNSSEEVYSEKQLQRLLEKHYGKDRVFISWQAGRRNIVCFRDMASFTVHKQWEEARSSDISNENLRTMETAAKLIRAELKEQTYDMDLYLSLYGIKNINVCGKFVLPLLQTLLQTLVMNDLKHVAIGNCVVQAAWPRSVISTVLYSVCVEMDNVFGTRWLVDELARLGFSITSDEVPRFRQSTIQAEKAEQVSVTKTEELKQRTTNSFVQWIADNVDHNTATLDGEGTFHGMGIIAVRSGLNSHVPDSGKHVIPT